MTKRNAVSIALAASVLFASCAGAFAQAPSPHAKTPAQATGSGKDTGMQIQSGMSGNGGGGVGSVASAAATGAGAGKSGASKMKKSAKHSKKHSASSTSSAH